MREDIQIFLKGFKRVVEAKQVISTPTLRLRNGKEIQAHVKVESKLVEFSDDNTVPSRISTIYFLSSNFACTDNIFTKTC